MMIGEAIVAFAIVLFLMMMSEILGFFFPEKEDKQTIVQGEISSHKSENLDKWEKQVFEGE